MYSFFPVHVHGVLNHGFSVLSVLQSPVLMYPLTARVRLEQTVSMFCLMPLARFKHKTTEVKVQ